MSKIWVKPGGDDRRVPWPGIKGRYFPADRAVEVDDTDHYIARRLADKDLVATDPPAPDAPVAPAATAAPAIPSATDEQANLLATEEQS